MKLKIKEKDFKDAVHATVKMASGGTALPILSQLLLEAMPANQKGGTPSTQRCMQTIKITYCGMRGEGPTVRQAKQDAANVETDSIPAIIAEDKRLESGFCEWIGFQRAYVYRASHLSGE